LKAKHIIWAINLLTLTLGKVSAQEQRLRSGLIPAAIQAHIEVQYPSATHLRYYAEQVHDSLFIEAELRHAGSAISLQFHNNQCVEVERDIQFEEIPSPIRQAIAKSLDSLAIRYHLISCQEVNPGKSLVYEIEFKRIKGRPRGFFEAYFDPKGQLIQLSSVDVPPMTSHF
jgi:hypothetical protein